jgi:hypothetical protein
MHGMEVEYVMVLVGKPEGKSQVRRFLCGSENNIKMVVKEV